MLECLDGYKPADLGFGEEFPEFRKDPRTGREVQLEAIEHIAYATRRVVAAAVPTGVGKSLIAVATHKILGVRTAILTATKGLQKQYVDTMGKYGLVEIKGKANYGCVEHAGLSCREGGVVGCGKCGGKGCTYERAKQQAKFADLVSANYAYWLNVNDKGRGLEDEEYGEEIGMLVLDEAHEADRLLADYLSVRIYENEIVRWVEKRVPGDERAEWVGIAGLAVAELKDELEELKLRLRIRGRNAGKKEVDEYARTEKLLAKMERVRGIGEDWVIERRDGTRWGRMWAFDVIWPGRYAEQYLFCHVPKIVLMSATLRPKTLGLLGVGKTEYEFREWERVFPANRHPIYSIPARNGDGKEVRIDRRTTGNDMGVWVDHIDRIIGGRLDRKGLIQTVSYDRQRYLLDHSRYAEFMLGNTGEPDSETAVGTAEEFRKRKPPAILVSPSFAQGWDFPGKDCEYVIICKVPFKPGVGKVMKAREERDPMYGSYLAMQEMVQGCGRGMRSSGDRCEVFVTDGHLNWFLHKNRSLAPSWFADAVRKVREIPDAPPRL